MSTQTHQPGRRGRPPKPGRVRVNLYVPAALAELLESDAVATGVGKSDRLAEILAAWYSGQEAMPKAS
jgi:hypothetical protein